MTVGEYLQLFLVVLVDEFTVFVVRAASEEPRLMLVQGRQPQVVKILPKLQNKTAMSHTQWDILISPNLHPTGRALTSDFSLRIVYNGCP